MDAPWVHHRSAYSSADRSYPNSATSAPATTSSSVAGEAPSPTDRIPSTTAPPSSPALVPMEVPSLLSTPSQSSSNSQPSQLSQQSSLDLGSPSPRPAVYDGDGPDPQSLSDYCADIKVLMDIDAQVQALGIHDSPSPTASRDGNSNFDSRENASSYSLEPHRHGQMGAFRHSPRFDQASRPIVSDNWRAKSAADSAGPLVSSLVTTAKPSTPTTQSQAQAQPRTSFVYTPARTPLTAPSNTGTAGFAQPNPNPLPTPASLSTPVSMSAPSHSQNHGHGYGHHSSTGSLALSAPAYSPVSARSGNPDPPSGSQMTGSLLSANHANTDANTSLITKPNTTSTVATFPVALPADALGYCFVRPNGMRTRLVPVDMLPFALQGIPPHESPGERLVALPVPGGVGADGRSSNTQMLRAVNQPNGSGGDAIQSTIDRILAAPASPPSSQHHHHHHQQTQQAILTTTTTTSQSQGQPHHTGAPKRMKVYCDKWVHEGVCAFTQQGCKYKHEMPSDRATQHQLGLFLGYPAWWKRRQAELARVVPVVGASAAAAAATTTTNREGGDVAASSSSPASSSGAVAATSVTATATSTSTSTAGGRRRVGDETGAVRGIDGVAGRRFGVDAVRPRQIIGCGGVNGMDISMVTSDSEREAGGAGFDHWLPTQGQTGGSLGLTGSRWGLASGNGPGFSPTTATAPQTGRDRLLRPTWRFGVTPQSGDGQTLQGSDGLGGYRPAGAEFATTGLFTRAWPWEQQQYALPSSQTQTQTQHRPQGQSNTTYSYGAASPCTFAFHPITTTTSAPSSPFGPIAPPTPRSARPQQPDNHTTTTATTPSTRRSSPLRNRRASTTTTSPYAGPSSPLHAPAGEADNGNCKDNDSGNDNSEAAGGDEGQSRNSGLLRGLKFE